jgi:hypothetical protein
MAVILVLAGSLAGFAAALVSVLILGVGVLAGLALWIGIGVLCALAGLAICACPRRTRDPDMAAKSA